MAIDGGHGRGHGHGHGQAMVVVMVMVVVVVMAMVMAIFSSSRSSKREQRILTALRSARWALLHRGREDNFEWSQFTLTRYSVGQCRTSQFPI